VNWTLASRLLISIRILLVIEKGATPPSQDPDLSVVRDRRHANFEDLRQGEVRRTDLPRTRVNRKHDQNIAP
jgi:hypothetical protein